MQEKIKGLFHIKRDYIYMMTKCNCVDQILENIATKDFIGTVNNIWLQSVTNT